MSSIVLLDLLTPAFVGLLTGVEIAVHFGFREPARRLNERSQLQLRHALVLRLRMLIPALFLPALAAGIADLILNRTGPGVLFRCLGVAFMAVWIATRVVGTVRINAASLKWDVTAPPRNWQAVVDRAERFHVVGVWAALAAFAAFLVAVGLKITTG